MSWLQHFEVYAFCNIPITIPTQVSSSHLALCLTWLPPLCSCFDDDISLFYIEYSIYFQNYTQCNQTVPIDKNNVKSLVNIRKRRWKKILVLNVNVKYTTVAYVSALLWHSLFGCWILYDEIYISSVCGTTLSSWSWNHPLGVYLQEHIWMNSIVLEVSTVVFVTGNYRTKRHYNRSLLSRLQPSAAGTTKFPLRHCRWWLTQLPTEKNQ